MCKSDSTQWYTHYSQARHRSTLHLALRQTNGANKHKKMTPLPHGDVALEHFILNRLRNEAVGL